MRSHPHLSKLVASFAFALIAGAVPAFASDPVRVTLLVDFAQPVEVRLIEQIHREMDAALAVVGIDPEWLKYDLNRREWIEGEVAVIKFRGACAIVPARRSAGGGPLAWAHSVDGHILPFVDVECDRVAEYIRPKTDRIEGFERERMLARALGRVLAHELYHVLAGSNKHAAWGLTKPMLTIEDLVNQAVLLHPKSIQLLRGRLFAPDTVVSADGGR